MKKIDDVEMTIQNDEHGVFAISLVDKPAIQENFIFLNAHHVALKVTDEEKRVVVGLALIPNQKVYRSAGGKEFNIFFSEETIEKTQEIFMRNLNQNNATVDHEEKVQGVTVVESWIVEDEKNDKSNIFKLNAAKGSWVIKMKINNPEVWDRIKNGELKGFSIEGLFHGYEEYIKQSEVSEDEKLLQEIINLLK